MATLVHLGEAATTDHRSPEDPKIGPKHCPKHTPRSSSNSAPGRGPVNAQEHNLPGKDHNAPPVRCLAPHPHPDRLMRCKREAVTVQGIIKPPGQTRRQFRVGGR